MPISEGPVIWSTPSEVLPKGLLVIESEVHDGCSISSDSRRCLLGRWSWPLLLFAVVAVVAAFLVAWLWIAAFPPSPVGEVLNVTSPLAAGVMVYVLLATSRIVGDSHGYVDMVGLLVIRRVPVSAIAEVVADDGLRLVLRDGRRVGVVAYGSSLMGNLFGYRRATQASRRIVYFMANVPKNSGESEELGVTLRWQAIFASLALGVVLVVGTVVINTV